MLKQQTFIFPNPGGWKSKVKLQAGVVSGEGPPSGSQTAVVLLRPHLVEGGHGVSAGLIYKDTDPPHEAPPHDLTVSPSPPLIPPPWESGFQYMNLGRDTNIPSITDGLSKCSWDSLSDCQLLPPGSEGAQGRGVTEK